MSARYLAHAGFGIVLGGAIASACGGDDGGGTAGSFGGSGNVAGVGGSGNGAGVGGINLGGTGALDLDGSLTDGNIDPDAACDLQEYEATLVKKPVDIIFVVDNSCSMTNEAIAIQNNINNNFAQIIQASGLDYRVILIAEHGPANPDESLCIDPPLSGGACPSPVPANTPPINNPPIFYHYDNNDVESHDSWCKMLGWYKTADRYNLAPTGWSEWLRQEAYKTFVEVTDDGVACSTFGFSFNDADAVAQGQTAAQLFDTALLTLDPAQFGTAQDRNYIWHSIVGITANAASADKSYSPTDPMVTSLCTTAVDPGTGYQALSNMTGGLRFPVCEGSGFDAVFKKIAEGVIKGAKVQCEFPLPDPPAGKALDPSSIQIEFTPSSTGTPQKFSQVGGAASCQAGSFYVEGDKIKLCPATCTVVQGDDNAKLKILALCKAGGPA